MFLLCPPQVFEMLAFTFISPPPPPTSTSYISTDPGTLSIIRPTDLFVSASWSNPCSQSCCQCLYCLERVCILFTCWIGRLLCSRIRFLGVLTLRLTFRKNGKVSIVSGMSVLAFYQNCQIFLLIHFWPILCLALQCCNRQVKLLHFVAPCIGIPQLSEK